MMQFVNGVGMTPHISEMENNPNIPNHQPVSVPNMAVKILMQIFLIFCIPCWKNADFPAKHMTLQGVILVYHQTTYLHI